MVIKTVLKTVLKTLSLVEGRPLRVCFRSDGPSVDRLVPLARLQKSLNVVQKKMLTTRIAVSIFVFDSKASSVAQVLKTGDRFYPK